MTVEDALNYFSRGDIYSLERYCPLGVTINEVFESCVNYGSGPVMDILAKHCGILRMKWNFNTTDHEETDVQLRARILFFLKDNSFEIKNDCLILCSSTKGCNHEWKLYQGFTDTFEYCIHCPEKKL